MLRTALKAFSKCTTWSLTWSWSRLQPAQPGKSLHLRPVHLPLHGLSNAKQRGVLILGNRWYKRTRFPHHYHLYRCIFYLAMGSSCRAGRPVVNPGVSDDICHPGPSQIGVESPINKWPLILPDQIFIGNIKYRRVWAEALPVRQMPILQHKWREYHMLSAKISFQKNTWYPAQHTFSWAHFPHTSC